MRTKPTYESRLYEYVRQETTYGGKRRITNRQLQQYAMTVGMLASTADRTARQLVEDGKLKSWMETNPMNGKKYNVYSVNEA